MTDFRTLAVRVLSGPATVVVFCLLFVPFVLGVFDARLMTPLAAPGYTVMLAMTAVGSRLVSYDLWIYWVPFLAACYAVAVAAGGLYYGFRLAR
ncbi:hypothetical protein [Saliphagus infecundisoli]|uniref:Uncharacterized protein n=1 Tax=Saliphagus infecundisoli TaxID=1849069 RepID=A0ABD5QBS3_9EURY|nr:hypothetical protein [Saliphagus infecundisoli]